jgi:hypothetical protein
MRIESIVRVCAGVVIVVGTCVVAAPGQTARPGQMTQARVFIENRGRGEAVPISIQDASLDAPLRVRVVNMQDAKVKDEAIHARLVQQSWDYHTVVVKDGQDPVVALIGPGAAGWEATGVAFVKAEGVTLLLKRPHVP